MPSDAELAKACSQGDERAWETIVLTHSKRVFQLAYRYTGRVELAEDLTQDIFLRIHQNLTSYDPLSGTLQSWVLRVARNLIIDQYRKTRHYQDEIAGSQELETLELVESQRKDPYTILDAKERETFVMNGLNSLSHELREAIILRDIEGYSYQEITETLNIPEGTVKSRINRARIELANILKKRKAKF